MHKTEDARRPRRSARDDTYSDAIAVDSLRMFASDGPKSEPCSNDFRQSHSRLRRLPDRRGHGVNDAQTIWDVILQGTAYALHKSKRDFVKPQPGTVVSSHRGK